MRAPLVEPVFTDSAQSFLFAFDPQEFAGRAVESRLRLSEWTGKPVDAAEVSGFCLNHELYQALGQAGFGAVLAASDEYASRGHYPCHPSCWGDGPLVLYRLTWLSQELAYRLRIGPGEPERMADTVFGMPGEVVLMTFHLDEIAFSSLGLRDSLAQLAAFAAACAARGVELLTVSDAASRTGPQVAQVEPPILTDGADVCIERLWRDGWWERLIYGRMQQASQITSLAPDAAFRSIGHWLLQRANLTAPQWAAGRPDKPPVYWRGLWWEQLRSYDDTASQVLAVLDTYIKAAARHIAEEVMT